MKSRREGSSRQVQACRDRDDRFRDRAGILRRDLF